MKILIADKEESSGLAIKRILEQEELDAEVCSNGNDVLEIIRKNRDIRVIILNRDLQGIDGITLCKELRKLNFARYLYIVIITEDNKNSIYDAMDAGADDYITKKLDKGLIAFRIKSGIRILDVEEKLFNSQKELIKYVKEDAQTALLNRRSFMDEAISQLERAFRETYQVSMIIVNLINFKDIDEKYDKQFVEKMLFETAGKLKNVCRPYDVVGRYSDAEFIFLLPNTDINNAKKIAKRLKSALSKKTYEVKGKTVRIDFSIGVSSISPDIGLKADQIENLARKTEIALNRAIEEGTNTIAVNS